ncbi:MAG: flagellar motor protein MotB [Phycisphaerae bacterium]|jgi:chemotaxis protein MotB|nr:flagellar motor protein MotB [Phycisphaerae bacterium]
MAKKCKCPEGVPEWIVTYGDMMSLLLCFFILLAAFSELKDEDDYQEVIQAIKEAFGYTDGSGLAPTERLPQQSMLEMLEEVALHKERIRKLSQADDPGVTGRQTTVKRIREGLQFTVGGLITFEPGSADLKPQATDELAKVANVIRGQNNKVEVRGHASAGDLPAGSAYEDLWVLSAARARSVMRHLTDQQDIDPRRMRVTGCSDTEPLVARVYDEAELAVNRRVEIIVTESLAQEFDAARQQETAAVINEPIRGKSDG